MFQAGCAGPVERVMRHPSAIGFGAIPDGKNAQKFSARGEEDSVAAEAQPEFAGVPALECLHIAHSADGVPLQTIEDLHGCGTVESANIGARLLGPLDAKRHSL